MKVWSREELYGEVWEERLIKVAAKYRLSDVTLGKICRKLKIPLPGLGYWARKHGGQLAHFPALNLNNKDRFWLTGSQSIVLPGRLYCRMNSCTQLAHGACLGRARLHFQ